MIACNEKCVKAHWAQAEMFLARGERKAAIDSYSRAIMHAPNDAMLYFKRAEIYEEVQLAECR